MADTDAVTGSTTSTKRKYDQAFVAELWEHHGRPRVVKMSKADWEKELKIGAIDIHINELLVSFLYTHGDKGIAFDLAMEETCLDHAIESEDVYDFPHMINIDKDEGSIELSINFRSYKEDVRRAPEEWDIAVRFGPFKESQVKSMSCILEFLGEEEVVTIAKKCLVQKIIDTFYG